MIDSETITFIRNEVKRQMDVILSGVAGNSDGQYEDVQQLYPGMPTITKRPLMQPYGLASAAPDGTLQVVGKQGEHTGNRIVLGHRDAKKPAVAPGEVILYDANGGALIMREAGMELYKNEVNLLEVQIRLIKTIINARTNTIFGPQPLIPNPAGAAMRETFIDIQQDLTKFKGGVNGPAE